MTNKNPFTRRELLIISLLSDGLTDNEIAAQLQLSFNTIRTHRKNILNHANNANMIAIVKRCLVNGWIR